MPTRPTASSWAAEPEQYGYECSTWDAATGAREDSRAIFGKVMFLVAITAGFAAMGAYIGRDLSGGWALICWIAALGLTIAMSFGRRREAATGTQMDLLFGVGALLGLAIGPTLQVCASVQGGSTVIAQAAGLTALFMAVLGAIGYSTSRDLSALGRVSFIALIALLLFGIVAIFVNTPEGA